VLTGVIGAYLAAGLEPLDAASAAAFVHGLAGRLAAAGRPVTSRDLVDALPDAFAALG
jgi:NAD(P)H-hydrate repair Nnr-like enzyme with NAD(P)H-hydrate dehydratase domain